MGDEKTASAAPLWGEFMTSSGPNHFFTAKPPRKTREDGFFIFFKTWRSW
jgi:hypothetical protein